MNLDTLFPHYCEILLKSTAVLVAVALLLKHWRGASAATRHLVWAGIMVVLIALPLTRLSRPRWTVGLPAVLVRSARAQPVPVALPHQVVAAAAAPVPTTGRVPLPWRSLLIVGWLGGAAVLLLYRATGAVQSRRLRRCSRPLDNEDVRELVRAITAGERWASRVELRCSQACRVPLTWGIWRPVVLLPEAALGWSVLRLSAALCHEYGHIRRQDGMTRLLANLACAIYWMHPLVWLASRQLRLAQEQACDDLALLNGADAADYAGLLVELARGGDAEGGCVRHAFAMAHPSRLDVRVRAILEASLNRRVPSRRAQVLVAVSILAAAAVSALAQVASLPDENETQILVSARFLEVGPGASGCPELQRGLKDLSLLDVGEAAELLKTADSVEGVDLLSAPRVVTRSKQEALIRIGQELFVPTEWEPGGQQGEWRPKKYETKEVGITFGVRPFLEADGAITLAVAPAIVELLGYLDLDDGMRPIPSSALAPEGHRVQAVFASRKRTAKVTLRPGQTVVLGGPLREEVVTLQDKTPVLGDIPLLGRLFRSEEQMTVKRQIWFVVSAERLEPGAPR